MKTFKDLEHMRLYRQPLIVPFNEKNKKHGTAINLLDPDSPKTEAFMTSEMVKNPHLVEGYYVDKGIAHLIANQEDSVQESNNSNNVLDESFSVLGGISAGFLSKLAIDAALKYSKKYIDAKEAKTPAQKQAAAKIFQVEYNRGERAYNKFKSTGGDKPLRGVTPDAWWINWFGINSSDIKVIGNNKKNKVSSIKFKNMITDKKLVEKQSDDFKLFLKNKEFYLISSGVEDNGKLIPVKVEYFYCPQDDKIYKTDITRIDISILDYKHPITISDYLNRSKKSVIEIKDVLKICEEK